MDTNTADLPAPANPDRGVLSPYQQGVPVAAPMDDESSGNFSIMGFFHSLRRQLLPALVAGLCLATLLAGALWFLIPVSYTAEAILKVNRDQFPGTSGDFMIFKETQSQMLKSTFISSLALQDSEIQQLSLVKRDHLGRTRKRPAVWLSGAVSVAADENELIFVSMKGHIKDQTERLLKEVIDTFETNVINRELLEKNDELSRLRTRYQDVYDKISTETEQIEKLAALVGGLASDTIRREQMMKLDELRQAQLEAESLNRSFREARAKYNMLNTEMGLLGNNQPTANMVADEMDRDPVYFDLGLQIQQIQDMLQMNEGRIPANSPQMMQATEQLGFLMQKRKTRAAELQPRIVERLRRSNGVSPQDLNRDIRIQETLLKDLNQQLQAAKQQYLAKREEMAKFGGNSGELVARMNLLEAYKQDLQSIQEAKTELEMEIDGRAKVDIYQEPAVLKPSNLVSKVVQIVGGWVISFLGIVGAVAYWDYLGQRVNDPSDMTTLNRVIGCLPGIQGFKGDITEPMRVASDSVRAAIVYNRQIPSQCVLVTSATGLEGRSTVASQLAISMARAGKVALLIDGDVRNPQQHLAFQVQPNGGFGEMLRGELTSDQAIVPTSVENLWLLSAGQCDQRSIRGLSGPQADAMFEDFRARFDAIIIDASPVLTSPDALLLGQHVDGAVLSVRRDISQVPKVNAAAEQLTSVGIPIIGSVLNGGSVEMRTGVQLAAPAVEEEKPALAAAEA